MGRPPAFVFVVRHGNRLDAADKQWHLTSPTPYDPPLTYGGWLQSKNLGARIASILQEKAAETQDADADADTDANDRPDRQISRTRKKKCYRVILHSSPFLRCIQTSVAISSGLASTPSLLSTSSEQLPPQAKCSRVNQTSSFSNPAPSRTRPTISTDIPLVQTALSPNSIEKTVLRIDSFLGEWASPDYFDHITPPPKSSLMLMTAKADLLRKEDYMSYPQFNTQTSVLTTPSQLWNAPSQTREVGSDNSPKPNGSGTNLSDRRPQSNNESLLEEVVTTGYIAPIPAYAVSSSAPIPSGYVAHARDACVDIDYQWDSSRDPFAWGEGGVLPEEWAAMHQRFRKGLKRLVDWYTTSEHPGKPVTRTPSAPQPVKFGDGDAQECAIDEDEYDYDNVVILVSHGAGCNALVGGITNHPVLADVPMASLTMAQRRAAFDDTTTAMEDRAMSSLEDALLRNKVTVPEMYELAMFANTEHLTGSGNVSRSSSINAGPRGRDTRGFGSALRDINFGAHYGQTRDHRSNSLTTTLNSMRRSSGGLGTTARSPSIVSSGGTKGGITVGSGVTSFGTAARTNTWGLWTPKQQAQDPEEEPDLPMTLDFGLEKEAPKKSPPPEAIVEMPEHEVDDLPVLSPSARNAENNLFDAGAFPAMSSTGSGLWGTPRPPDDAEKLRDFSSQKRRWTVTERQPISHHS